MREGIILVCQGCKDENYITKVNKKQKKEKLEIKKYCAKCNKHILHIQKK